jgi:hypothetical protein
LVIAAGYRRIAAHDIAVDAPAAPPDGSRKNENCRAIPRSRFKSPVVRQEVAASFVEIDPKNAQKSAVNGAD